MSLLSRVKSWATGETLTAADLNSEFNNVIDNMDPDNVEDASANAAAMQAVADPYPASAESLATTLRGELQRIRYVLKQVTGESQWYIDPTASLYGALEDNTYAMFYQDAAPTNWTIQNTLDDKVVMITKGSVAGGQIGGAVHSAGTWTQPGLIHKWYDYEPAASHQSHNSAGTQINLTSATPLNLGISVTALGSSKLSQDFYTDSQAVPNTYRPAAYNMIIAKRA